MRLIRFRPLKNEDDLNHLKETIKNNQFYCSNFLDMNDPMEGVFTTTDIANINNVFSGKNSFKICSFTGDGSLNNPLLWGYYANGFKGAAIEVEVRVSNIKEIIKNKKGITKVNYVSQNKFNNIIKNLADANETALNILSRKLTYWKHEKEYRFFAQSEKNFHEIGEIKKIYFGDPYGTLKNKESIIEASSKYNRYLESREILENVCNDKNILFGYINFR